ncbi:thiamine phosphate synthase [Sinimarinibacterium sp. NLF-5-8]|uniref:thiamine phosphate synthase n=1 Tax=Sinimarinibacterium sp. NLF-5-8 TaxID=2698684 RepID=UPI00137BB017|nr:thiamine phosphate synthase [Sinimarinibacterium sp. NLF-5-8]QHS08809.1 thiamine phosphate synthase [Sinimarinibacterium sp. NLF-5-8]
MSRLLYAITSQALVQDRARLYHAVSAAVDGGARLIQYRDKWNPPAQRPALARALLRCCHAAGARLIINDDPVLAQAIGADGVHVGQTDASLARARALLGADAIIGVTCGNDLARAQAAVDGGASYIAFGRFFASTTKPDAPPADLATLRRARARWPRLPICAIGGITPDNAAQVVQAGADWIAVVAGVFEAADARAAAAAYCTALTMD